MHRSDWPHRPVLRGRKGRRERAGQRLTMVVVHHLLQEHPAQALHHGALGLAVQGERIDDAPDILHRDIVAEGEAAVKAEQLDIGNAPGDADKARANLDAVRSEYETRKAAKQTKRYLLGVLASPWRLCVKYESAIKNNQAICIKVFQKTRHFLFISYCSLLPAQLDIPSSG